LDISAACEAGASAEGDDATNSSGQKTRYIRPTKDWRGLGLVELWNYRELVLMLAWRDLAIRYKETVLGVLWAVMQPALTMLVFTLFLGRTAAANGEPSYALFVYTGLVPWFFFSSAVGQASQSIVSGERLITKVYFPRLAMPIAAVGAATVDFAITFGLLILMMLWFGTAPGLSMLFLLLLIPLLAIAALGIGALLSALNVAYRDFRYVTPFMLQLWLLATPAIYLSDSSRAGVPAWLDYVNPMNGFVSNFRAACLGGTLSFRSIAAFALVGIVSVTAARLYFFKIEDDLSDLV